MLEQGSTHNAQDRCEEPNLNIFNRLKGLSNFNVFVSGLRYKFTGDSCFEGSEWAGMSLSKFK